MASFRRGCSRADSGLGCRPALGRRDLSEVAVLWQLSAHGLNEVVRSEEHLAFQLFPWCRLTLAVGDESGVLRDGIRRRLTGKRFQAQYLDFSDVPSASFWLRGGGPQAGSDF
jgi:hypothetical protein